MRLLNGIGYTSFKNWRGFTIRTRSLPIMSFLSHLHDGEQEECKAQLEELFLSHLHDGELNEFCYIFGYFNLLKNI